VPWNEDARHHRHTVTEARVRFFVLASKRDFMGAEGECVCVCVCVCVCQTHSISHTVTETRVRFFVLAGHVEATENLLGMVVSE
jgi:hypothetical protein